MNIDYFSDIFDDEIEILDWLWLYFLYDDGGKRVFLVAFFMVCWGFR